MFSPVNYFRVVFEKNLLLFENWCEFTVYFPILYPFIDYCTSLTFYFNYRRALHGSRSSRHGQGVVTGLLDRLNDV